MTTTILSLGNSQGFCLPKELMRELHLSVGDKLKVFVKDKKILIIMLLVKSLQRVWEQKSGKVCANTR